jgi:hypothetical protein
MSDLITESYGVHFTSSLLKELKKDDLLKHLKKRSYLVALVTMKKRYLWLAI